MRDVKPDELLGRPAVSFEDKKDPLTNDLTGETILVTGAGGSIGSELCRQIAEFRPKTLIMYERNENNLYYKDVEIENIHYIDESHLLDKLKTNDINGLFSMSAKNISRKLEEDPDIESVVVEKQFPGTLRIIVKERTPYAEIWVDDSEYFLDYYGIVLWREQENASLRSQSHSRSDDDVLVRSGRLFQRVAEVILNLAHAIGQ